MSFCTLQMYDAALERYVPVLMAMARIYWERENYPVIEKLFRQAAEFCSDHDVWKLNTAHVFFMEEKFKVRKLNHLRPSKRHISIH